MICKCLPSCIPPSAFLPLFCFLELVAAVVIFAALRVWPSNEDDDDEDEDEDDRLLAPAASAGNDKDNNADGGG